jgi:excisionase family DNA binding protein
MIRTYVLYSNKEATMIQDSMLTIRQVAAYLHVVPLTIYRLIERGELPACKVGRVWRVRKQDLQAYLSGSTPAQKGENEEMS